MRTTVKKWFLDKGFGFLNNGSDLAPDIIVFASELKNCEFLKPGRTVEFECYFNDKGLIAKNVRLVYESSVDPKTNQKNFHHFFKNTQRNVSFDKRNENFGNR